MGVGEGRALGEIEVMSGNIKLAMSHVLPDLAQKALRGQDPLHILGEGNQIRCYTHGADLARGIALCVEKVAATNTDFNLSTRRQTSVLELAETVWRAVNPGKPFRYTVDSPFEYDVQKRVPDIRKAERELGFVAEISLEQAVAEVVAWCRGEIERGHL